LEKVVVAGRFISAINTDLQRMQGLKPDDPGGVVIAFYVALIGYYFPCSIAIDGYMP
jgi:hypothetical protein